MHDIRFCDRCRADVSEGIFERVPHGWASYIRDGKVDRHDPVFDWVHRKIPTFLQCTIDDAYRPSFEIQGSTGQGVVSKSPRYSFPTKGSVRKGIFVCSQYEVRRDGGLGDYLVSIIVGRDELRKYASNSRLAIRDAVKRAREILGVDPAFRPRPQGVYRSEIIFQTEFRRADPPTAEQFRRGLNRMLGLVARNQPALDLLWDEILDRADQYPIGVDVAEIHRRGRRGEQWVLDHERERLRCLGRPDLAKQVRKLPAKGPNHDVLTFRIMGGEARDHYVHAMPVKHFIEVKTTSKRRFGGTMSRLQTQFAFQHPDSTSLAIFTDEEESAELEEPRILSSMEERRPYLHHDVVARWRREGCLPF